ncbi:hypothetical protein KFE96_06485 [Kordiimonas sp. SCSIO 12603]|uniref:DUF6404 family protein n=1 Tax=Kordiimonas sp. SCSIO 12603 TaxID=2829596 RepID=UPI002104AD7D|nr:DUF6404 family protein [Kordiimonas sp. SCSIO 12603]UTW59947.1 hypothetical protein KFE96_06485 [Kordiimonas sp. SCSIO 12603]
MKQDPYNARVQAALALIQSKGCKPGELYFLGQGLLKRFGFEVRPFYFLPAWQRCLWMLPLFVAGWFTASYLMNLMWSSEGSNNWVGFVAAFLTGGFMQERRIRKLDLPAWGDIPIEEYEEIKFDD